MSHLCRDCGKEFETAQGLKRHTERKTPCSRKAPNPESKHACANCGRDFATASSLVRHTRGRCHLPQKAKPVTLDTITQQMLVLQNMVESLSKQTSETILVAAEQEASAAAAAVTNQVSGQVTGQLTQVNGPLTQVTGTLTQVTNNVNNNISVSIRPWGAALELTDGDVAR